MHLGRALGTACAVAMATSVVAARTAAAGADASLPTAISRDPGLTAQQAEQRFAPQNMVAAVEPALSSALGDAFGGAYLDDATSTVRAGGARATLVRYSQPELDATKSTWTSAPRGKRTQ